MGKQRVVYIQVDTREVDNVRARSGRRGSLGSVWLHIDYG
jgi:hypothetical protein